jgi:hypothetical protein
MNLDRWPAQLAFLVAAFAVATLIALAVGAANLGTAATFGQLAFAAAFMWLIGRPTRRPAPPPAARSGRGPRSGR